MKWYEWVLVIILIIAGGLISYYFSFKEINKPIYVVDLTKLIDDKFSRQGIKDVYERKITPRQYLEERKKYLDKLQKVLKGFEKPVFIKQAIVGGKTIDITGQVKKYLEE